MLLLCIKIFQLSTVFSKAAVEDVIYFVKKFTIYIICEEQFIEMTNNAETG